MRSCGPSRRTRSSGPRSPRCRCSTGRSTRERFRDKVDRASRADPPPAAAGRRQPVLAGAAPLGGRPQLRPRLPPPHASTPAVTGGEREVLDLAQWVGMQGFDRARPLWEMYLVDGMADGRSALIQKLHHAITDGVGSIQIALTLFDLERDPAIPGPMPDAPDVPRARLGRAPDRRARPTSDAGGVGSAPALGRARSPAACAVPLADPVGAARRSPTPWAPWAACSRPATQPLSPVMADRSLSVRFATLVRPLDDLRAGGQGRRRQAQRRLRRRCGRRAAALPRAAGRTRRGAAHDDADQRPHRGDRGPSPATSSCPPASPCP